jgi:uncharacterized protein YdeI (YjbR/CyaY-like superfamily)
MTASDDLPVIPFPSKDAWHSWLEAQYATAPGVWLKIAKRASGIESVTHEEALEVALCHGWIDGTRRSFDDDWFLQRFTPRRARSKWSQVNVAKATALIESGEMRPAGVAEIERAKADGRWEAAYGPQRSATVPDDLQRELDRYPEAREFFPTLNSQNRYAILYRIEDAKRPETRARRIEKFVEMLRRGEKLHP